MTPTATRPDNGNRRWSRNYTPGYTGFVPAKVELFGKTAGKINEEICRAGGRFENLITDMDIRPDDLARIPATTKSPRIMFGNRSRHGNTWIGGPTHEVIRQHIPGYQGWVQGNAHKGEFNKSQAKVSARMFAMQEGTMKEEHFPKSTNRLEFRASNFRRFGKCLPPVTLQSPTARSSRPKTTTTTRSSSMKRPKTGSKENKNCVTT